MKIQKKTLYWIPNIFVCLIISNLLLKGKIMYKKSLVTSLTNIKYYSHIRPSIRGIYYTKYCHFYIYSNNRRSSAFNMVQRNSSIRNTNKRISNIKFYVYFCQFHTIQLFFFSFLFYFFLKRWCFDSGTCLFFVWHDQKRKWIIVFIRIKPWV